MENQMITLQFKTTNDSYWKTANNQLHRLHGKPAWQVWYENGQKNHEEYYEHGQLHRLNSKPAWQAWYKNGQKNHEEYYENGRYIK